MGGVGDDDDVVQAVGLGDLGEASGLLRSGEGVGFGDDSGEGDALSEQIVAAYAAFRVAGVAVAASAQSDDEWGDLPLVERDSVVEAGMVDGRRVAAVLGCAEDSDCVGGLGLIICGDLVDAVDDPEAPASAKDDGEEGEAKAEVSHAVRGLRRACRARHGFAAEPAAAWRGWTSRFGGRCHGRVASV